MFLQRRLTHFENKEEEELVNELIVYEREKDAACQNRLFLKYSARDFPRNYQY